jgi:hypothetical protein
MAQREPYPNTVIRGAVAGMFGSMVQTGVGLLLDRFLLPPRQHNNIAPRLIKRLRQWRGGRGRTGRDWTLGTLFHLGYGLGWGTMLSLVRRWTSIQPVPLGGLAGGLIYLLAFSGRGVGTLTATEPPPRARSWRKQLSLVAVAWVYALATTESEQQFARWNLPRAPH